MTDPTRKRIARAEQALALVCCETNLDVRSTMLALLEDLRCAADHHGLDFASLAATLPQNCDATCPVTAGEATSEGLSRRAAAESSVAEYRDEEFEIADDSREDGLATIHVTPGERQTRPLAEQTLDDFDEFFRRCPGMTFIFLAPGEVNTVYPDVITAIQLADCLSRGTNFEQALENEPPLPPADAFSRQELVSEIQARVREMDRRGVQYRLIWNLAGDSEVCVHSSDMDGNDEIVELLVDELRDVFKYS